MDFDEAKRASRAVSAQGGEGMPTYACVRHGTSAHEGCGYCEQAQEFRTARLARLRDAVVEEAVAWAIARDSKIPVDIINGPFFDASNRLGAAVDAYQAAKEIP